MTPSDPAVETAHAERLRLDRWLVFTRFCKTRAVAQDMIGGSRIRINGRVVEKPHADVRVGDVLTLPLHTGNRNAAIVVVRVAAIPVRRGPAAEARACYEILPPGGSGN